MRKKFSSYSLSHFCPPECCIFHKPRKWNDDSSSSSSSSESDSDMPPSGGAGGSSGNDWPLSVGDGAMDAVAGGGGSSSGCAGGGSGASTAGGISDCACAEPCPLQSPCSCSGPKTSMAAGCATETACASAAPLIPASGAASRAARNPDRRRGRARAGAGGAATDDRITDPVNCPHCAYMANMVARLEGGGEAASVLNGAAPTRADVGAS